MQPGSMKTADYTFACIFTRNLLNMWLELCIFILVSTRVSSFVNVAHDTAQKLQGTATMSEDPQLLEWKADKAVDGNTNQSIPNCAIMDFSKDYKSVWWKVRLKNRYNIAYLEVYFRKSTINRATGYYFYSYDSSEIFDGSLPNPKNLIYHHDPMTGCPSSITNITVNRLGQEIVFLNKRISGFVTDCVIDDPAHVGVEICEVKVMGCDVNRYSSNKCGEECDMKCKSKNCDVFNGSCIYGCSNSNALTIDCIVCRDGEYIVNGKCEPCGGHCKLGTSCNKTTGKCDSGCENHWTGEYCSSCPYPYYGSECNTHCGQCSGNDKCDNVTGDCPHGCRLHWQEPKCDECIDGHFGENCTFACGYCVNGDVCDKHNGTCYQGCMNHFRKPTCDVCEDGFYNKNCTGVCGNCLHYKPCDRQSGNCTEGCEPHYQPPLCQECSDGFYGGVCNATCGFCVNGEPCDKQTGNCLNGCHSNFHPPLCKDEMSLQMDESGNKSNLAVIAGGVVAAVIVVVAIGLLGFFIKRRLRDNSEGTAEPFQFGSNQARTGTRKNRHADLSDNPIERPPEENTNEGVDDGGYYNTSEVSTYIRTEELEHVISEKNTVENNIFLLEYKRLPVGDADKCTVGQQSEHVVKNRFKTTFPYDHSRVILKEKWTDSDDDYINANYIKDYTGERVYIAAQGPKNTTLTDFWRMIWQENIKFIVMLTNIVENGKNKCTQYWPEKDKIMDVGPCKVKLLEEIEQAFHTFRKFTVQNNSTKRTITQFHYTAWPDHGTPEELGLVHFHRAVTKTYQTGGLMLVHCSAGVGRTGTFIGLDSLLKQGRESGRINVFEFVKQMREDRMTMVQTTDQYVFLHKALLCGFQGKGTVIVENNIPDKFNSLLQDTSPLNQRPLYKEYKLLQTLKPVYNDKDKEDGKKPENIEKNKDLKILPVSKYRPYLTSYVKGRNDYINAVYVPSFTEPNGFILTQYPLKATEVDLWRLCMDHDVHALVLLGDNTEEVSWIPQKGSTSCCTPYSLTSGNTGSSISGVSENSLVISIEEQKQELCVFHIPTGNESAILKGVELLLEKEKQHPFTSVLLSKDGAGPTGVFCVLHNVLQQLRMDKEVDILTAVRQIQTRRPEVISKLDEYRKCYELILLSISEDGIYANM